MNRFTAPATEMELPLQFFMPALDDLDRQLEQWLDSDLDRYPDGYQELAEQICEGWYQLAETTAETGLLPLTDLISVYADNIDMFVASREDGLNDGEKALLRSWHRAARDFLKTPGDEKTAFQWVSLLQEPLWREPLDDSDVAELIGGLNALSAGRRTPDAAVALTTIAPEDITEYVRTDTDVLLQPLNETAAATVDRSLVRMIYDEFEKAADALRLAAPSSDAEPELYRQALHAEGFRLENIKKAGETVGLIGLSRVLDRVNLNAVAEPRDGLDFEQERDLFIEALRLIRRYLGDVENHDYCDDLARHLCAPGWRQPMPEPLRAPIASMLHVVLDNPEEHRNLPTPGVAQASDVALEIPDDVDRELVQTLLIELPPLSENFAAANLAITSGAASHERLLDAQRIAHTLKGACNTIGIKGIANLTHQLESILEALNTEQRMPCTALSAGLVDAADCLSSMSECLHNREPAPEQAIAVLQSVLDWNYRIQKDGVALVSVPAETVESAPTEAAETPELSETRTAPALMSIPSTLLDEIILHSAESGSIGERVREKLDGLLKDHDEIRELSWQLSELTSEMDRLVNIRGILSSNHHSHQGFDALELEQYGELHTCLNRLAEVAADVREHNAHMHSQLLAGKNLMNEQHTLQKERLESARKLRMIPVQHIVPSCRRIVRQTARMTGKTVDLDIVGEQTLVDNDILNPLTDALMHLLR
ncbi:MAG: Hpt domain-containing protein, partial [Gammaproteobacteria bacterium]